MYFGALIFLLLFEIALLVGTLYFLRFCFYKNGFTLWAEFVDWLVPGGHVTSGVGVATVKDFASLGSFSGHFSFTAFWTDNV